MRAVKVAFTTLLFVIAFDVAGALMALFFDVAPLRGGGSPPLFYAIWFVLGALCGFFSFNQAGAIASPKTDPAVDWSNREDSGRTGWFVIGVNTALVAALCALFYAIWWRSGDAQDVFVPDNLALSITFFGSMLAASIFANVALRPAIQSSRGTG